MCAEQWDAPVRVDFVAQHKTRIILRGVEPPVPVDASLPMLVHVEPACRVAPHETGHARANVQRGCDRVHRQRGLAQHEHILVVHSRLELVDQRIVAREQIVSRAFACRNGLAKSLEHTA